MTESVLVTFEEKVLPPGSPMADGAGRANRHAYNLTNGSSIVIGGLDKPSRTFSTEYDTITVFEAIEATENECESLQRALRNGRMGYHQFIADTNPGPKTHHLNQSANKGTMKRILSRHEDNPQFWDAELKSWTPAGADYIARLDKLTGHRKLRLRFGKWASAEGMVYEGFDSAIHIIDRFPIPDDWRRVRSIDFGYVHPFVCQWWAVDPDGRMYRYREQYMGQRLVEDHVNGMKNADDGTFGPGINSLSAGESYEATVSDHDREDRATLDRHGVNSYPANKDVSSGIQSVAERLKIAGDGKPRIFFMRDSLVETDQIQVEHKKPFCTEQEFDGYIWRPQTGTTAAKEEPLKEDDDGMDATRYACMYVDNPVANEADNYVYLA
jgi:phage terminase large subunit